MGRIRYSTKTSACYFGVVFLNFHWYIANASVDLGMPSSRSTRPTSTRYNAFLMYLEIKQGSDSWCISWSSRTPMDPWLEKPCTAGDIPRGISGILEFIKEPLEHYKYHSRSSYKRQQHGSRFFLQVLNLRVKNGLPFSSKMQMLRFSHENDVTLPITMWPPFELSFFEHARIPKMTGY